MNFFQAFIHRMFTSAIRQAGIWAMSAIGTKRTCARRTECPLSGVKRTLPFAPQMSAFDPKRTSPGFSGRCRSIPRRTKPLVLP